MSRSAHQNTTDLVVELSNRHPTIVAAGVPLCEAVRQIVADAGWKSAEISVAIVEDSTIHEINRKFLQHDYPTDVLSFLLEQTGDRIEGEIVLSADTAKRCAEELGESIENEMLLYAIHGALHLVGYRDVLSEEAAAMRAQERIYQDQFACSAAREPSSQ